MSSVMDSFSKTNILSTILRMDSTPFCAFSILFSPSNKKGIVAIAIVVLPAALALCGGARFTHYSQLPALQHEALQAFCKRRKVQMKMQKN